jgi:hypothetical protein
MAKAAVPPNRDVGSVFVFFFSFFFQKKFFKNPKKSLRFLQAQTVFRGGSSMQGVFKLRGTKKRGKKKKNKTKETKRRKKEKKPKEASPSLSREISHQRVLKTQRHAPFYE